MSGFIQSNGTFRLLDASQTLSANDSGKIMLIPDLTTGTRTITLPTAAAGLSYTFIVDTVAAAAIGRIAAITPAAAGTMYGTLMNLGVANATTLVPKSGVNSAQFTATAIQGDMMQVLCDGTRWHCSGTSHVAAGLA